MPFGALERPSLALGLLQSHCRRLDVACDDALPDMLYAARVGIEEYLWLGSDVPYTAFAGDWIFAGALYGPRPDDDARYVEDVLAADWQLGDDEVDADPAGPATQVEPFLAECLATCRGTTTRSSASPRSSSRTSPRSRSPRRIKEAHPRVTIAFGGANWEEAMGGALLRRFPFVDLAFSGEADQSFPAVLAARAAGTTVDGISGVTRAGAAPAREARARDAASRSSTTSRPRTSTRSSSSAPTSPALAASSRPCSWRRRAAAGGASARTARSAA